MYDKRKTQEIEILNTKVILSERNAVDVFNYYEELNKIRKDTVNNSDESDTMMRLTYLNCVIISQSLSVFYNSLKFYNLRLKYKVAPLLRPSYLYKTLPTLEITNLSNIVMQLDGMIKLDNDLNVIKPESNLKSDKKKQE